MKEHDPEEKASGLEEQSGGKAVERGTSASDAYQVGISSFYGKEFHGRKTANGEVFDMYAMTAAHRTLPFGTWIRVTNLRNGKRVVVKVNDRGPYVEGRILDLSYEAASRLDMVKYGTEKVKIEVLKGKIP